MVAMGGIEPPPPAFLGLRSPKINYTEYSVESSGRPPSRHPSASSTRLHFGQMPPLPRSRFRAHSIATRHTQIPQAVHQQIVLLHPQCQLIMALSFFAGLRRGEIAGLQWNDLDDQFIHVRRAVGAGIVGTPKTKKSIRSVPIIEPVRVLLLLWRAKYPDGVWMFPNERGTPANLKDLSRRLIRPALQRAACPWKGYQAGRRGLGTTLRALTGNSNAGRDLLGHTTTQTTQKHYESDMPQEALAGMKLLEAKSSK